MIGKYSLGFHRLDSLLEKQLFYNLSDSIDLKKINKIINDSSENYVISRRSSNNNNNLVSNWAKICFGKNVSMEKFSLVYISFLEYKSEKRINFFSKIKKEHRFINLFNELLTESRDGYLYFFKYSQITDMIDIKRFSKIDYLKVIFDNTYLSIVILDCLMKNKKFPKKLKKYLKAIHFDDIFI